MLSMGAEIDQRIRATNRAWKELYGMWWDMRVPIRIKRTLFRGAVCGASLTGLTALLLYDRDHLRLQKSLEKKPRALMLGTASWEGQDHTRTLSSRQVRESWRLALSCLRIVRAETLMVPEHRQRTSKARTSPLLLVGANALRNTRYTHRWSTFASRGKWIRETTTGGPAGTGICSSVGRTDNKR